MASIDRVARHGVESTASEWDQDRRLVTEVT